MLVKAGEEPDSGTVQTEEGGLKYEVVLEEAKTKRMPRPKSAPSSSPRNYQDIQQKLQVQLKIKSEIWDFFWNAYIKPVIISRNIDLKISDFRDKV